MLDISKLVIQLIKDLYVRYLPLADDKRAIPPIYTYNSREIAGFLYIHLLKQYEDDERYLEPELYHQH